MGGGAQKVIRCTGSRHRNWAKGWKWGGVSCSGLGPKGETNFVSNRDLGREVGKRQWGTTSPRDSTYRKSSWGGRPVKMKCGVTRRTSRLRRNKGQESRCFREEPFQKGKIPRPRCCSGAKEKTTRPNKMLGRRIDDTTEVGVMTPCRTANIEQQWGGAHVWGAGKGVGLAYAGITKSDSEARWSRTGLGA